MKVVGTQQMMKNHNLAKSIADVGGNRIIMCTIYWTKSARTTVILVDPLHISRKCSGGGNMTYDLKLSDHTYDRNVCDLTINRDFNAAINIE